MLALGWYNLTELIIIQSVIEFNQDFIEIISYTVISDDVQRWLKLALTIKVQCPANLFNPPLNVIRFVWITNDTFTDRSSQYALKVATFPKSKFIICQRILKIFHSKLKKC